MTKLELRDVTLSGFSLGGGEVARYLEKYGSEGVSKAVIISRVPPFLLKTADNRPDRSPLSFRIRQTGGPEAPT